MGRVVLAVLITCLAVGRAAAQSCDSQAVSAGGKPLHGAAKMSFVKKCKRRRLRKQSSERGRQAASRRGQEQLHEKVDEDGLEKRSLPLGLCGRRSSCIHRKSAYRR